LKKTRDVFDLEQAVSNVDVGALRGVLNAPTRRRRALVLLRGRHFDLHQPFTSELVFANTLNVSHECSRNLA